MAHQLIVNYGLYRKMNIYEPHLATFNEMTGFHSLDYINYIDSISNKSDTNIVKQCIIIYTLFIYNNLIKIILVRLIVLFLQE